MTAANNAPALRRYDGRLIRGGPMLKRFNPKTIPAPSGSYIHGIEVPPNARLLFIAGQTPGRNDGSVPENFEEQVEVCWKRIGAILNEVGMDFSNLVKVT